VPYKSEAQRKFFHANSKELAAQGVDIKEWDKASKGKKLPEKVKEASELPSIPFEPVRQYSYEQLKKRMDDVKNARTLPKTAAVLLAVLVQNQTKHAMDAATESMIVKPATPTMPPATPGIAAAAPPTMTPPTRPVSPVAPLSTPQSPASAQAKVDLKTPQILTQGLA
jgi:hypothetical protein